MAKVITAPSVKKGRGRALPIGLSRSQGVPADVAPEDSKDVSGNRSSMESPAPTHDLRYVEQLSDEVQAALERARIAELQLTELREQLDHKRNKAIELGYREGFQKGSEQAKAEQSKEIEAITSLLRALSTEHVQLIERAEDAAVEIGFAATVKLLSQASVDPSLVAAMVKQAMHQVSQREGLVIRLSPSDLQLIEQCRAREENTFEWPMIEFKSDEKLEYGGCVIESRAGTLDARLDLQMQELKNLLVEVRAHTYSREAD